MVGSRASGTLMASSLKQNTFLTLKLHPGGKRAFVCLTAPLVDVGFKLKPPLEMARGMLRNRVAGVGWKWP